MMRRKDGNKMVQVAYEDIEGKIGKGGRKMLSKDWQVFSLSTYSDPRHVIEVGMNLESDYLKTNATEMIFDIRYVAERGAKFEKKLF